MQLTENEKAIIDSEDTNVSVTLSFPNHEIDDITNEKIYLESMELEESLLDSDTLVFGKCNSAIFKVKVADFTEDISNAEMDVKVLFTNEEFGNYEMEFGNYIVSTAERTSDRRFRLITAYDNMTKFDKDISDWFNNTLYPSTISHQDLGWKIEDEDGISLTPTYTEDGIPETNTNEDDDNVLYVDNSTGYGYIGIANYNENGEYINTTWDKQYEFEKNIITVISSNVTHTINEILFLLCDYIGVNYDSDFTLINGNIVVGKNIEPTELTGRSLLEQICEANGVFGHFDNKGVLSFIAPNYNEDVQEISTYRSCEFEDFDVEKINSLQIRTSQDDAGVTITRSGITKVNQYVITGNSMLYGVDNKEQLETIADNILNIIEQIYYRPNNISISKSPYIDLGNALKVNARIPKGNIVEETKFNTIVLKRVLSGIQSIISNFSAIGSQWQNGVNKSVSEQINILNNNARDIVEQYNALKANFDLLNSHSITTQTLTSNVANIGTLNANSAFVKFITGDVINANYIRSLTADIGYLDADMANIDFANLNKANIGQLFANVGLISSATITDGHVTGYLDSVEVNANKITAGTLAVDRLLIKDSSGNYKMATYDSSGNLVTTTVNGSVITNRTITADHLVAGTITANEINMTNLVGNSAFINAINTNSIVVSASNNANTALNTVNNMEIGGRNLLLNSKTMTGYLVKEYLTDGTDRLTDGTNTFYI